MRQVAPYSVQKVRCWRPRTLAVALACMLGVGLSCVANGSISCPDYEQPFASAILADERLSEISGLVASRSQPGILWMHNDSGDDAVVYAIDLQGRMLAEIQLVDVHGAKIDAVDCEDIARGPDVDRDVLYLADIGDNAGVRDTIRIYRFPEPQMETSGSGQIERRSVDCTVIEVVYPDGARDAETLLVDPITGDIVLISKDFIHARAYRVPVVMGGIATMEFLVELPWGFITGGDMSSAGSNILLRGYWNAEIWSRSADEDWWAELTSMGCSVPLAQEPQGEAIGFSAGGDSYFTISEGIQSMLYNYRAAPSEESD